MCKRSCIAQIYVLVCLLTLGGCRLIDPMGNTGYVREKEALEVTFDLYFQLLDRDDRPVPGIDVLAYVSYSNWPAYAFSGPPFSTTRYIAQTDEHGFASLQNKHGYLAAIEASFPRLTVFIDGVWQTADRERSQSSLSSPKQDYPEGRTLPIPRDDPAIIRLREATREELRQIAGSLKYRQLEESSLPNYYQLPLPGHLEEGEVPDGYAGDAW